MNLKDMCVKMHEKFGNCIFELPEENAATVNSASFRMNLIAEHGITVSFDGDRDIRLVKIDDHSDPVEVDIADLDDVSAEPTTTKTKVTNVAAGHTYIMPREHPIIRAMVSDESAPIVCLSGPTGCGKTHYTRILAEELNMEYVHVTCRRDMDSGSFFGEKTVEVDEATGSNYIEFVPGPVVKAMTTGLDEDGNEVGKPAMLVVDEFPVLPAWLGVSLNNMMDRFDGNRRKVVLDDGRTIYSHSGFRMILLGNTIGRGITGYGDSLYAAQGDALDISTLERIDAIFHFGYSRVAEKKIVGEAIADKSTRKMVLKFRDSVRKARQANPDEMPTPFSTRAIVSIADLYRMTGDIEDAVWYGVISRLPSESADPREKSGERASYSEIWLAMTGNDLYQKYVGDNDYDY